MKHKIINGDCLNELKEIKDEYIHLTVTSPPYFNAKEYSQWPSYEDYLLFLERVFTEVNRITKSGRMCVVNLSPVIIARESRSCESKRLAIPYHFFTIMEKIGWKYIDDIIWVKPEGASINRNGGFFQHRKPVAYKPNLITETIFIFQKKSESLIDKVVRSYDENILKKSLVDDGYERSNVWYINPETKSKHPAPYPEELSNKIIKYYSFFGDIILDPFMGSGTTIVSCEKLGRFGIGIEIHKEYIEIAKKRLKQYEIRDLFFE
jgi:DNA modification methylase